MFAKTLRASMTLLWRRNDFRSLAVCRAHRGLPVGFLLLQYSVLFTVESLHVYLCFISLLYLDLYVLGDDALLSYGSFMQTKYLCVLIHI